MAHRASHFVRPPTLTATVAEHIGDARTARAERALVEKYWKNADRDLPELAGKH